MARKYEYLHTENYMLISKQIELAQSLGLRNTYVLGYSQIDPIGIIEVNRYPALVVEGYPFMVMYSTENATLDIYREHDKRAIGLMESDILESIVRPVHTQKNIVVNFLCHLDGAAGGIWSIVLSFLLSSVSGNL